MTTEACTTKLAYMFGRGISDLSLISKLLLQPIRGEISSASSYGKKFFNDILSNDFPEIETNGKVLNDKQFIKSKL